MCFWYDFFTKNPIILLKFPSEMYFSSCWGCSDSALTWILVESVISHLALTWVSTCVSSDHFHACTSTTHTSLGLKDTIFLYTKKERTSCLTFSKFTKIPQKFRICHNSVVKFIVFLLTQQLTKLSIFKGVCGQRRSTCWLLLTLFVKFDMFIVNNMLSS